MGKKSDRLQTTRLFSLQLANHDTLFAPKERGKRSFRWVKTFFFLLPAILIVTFPSFYLGRAVLVDPGKNIPDTLHADDLFILPVSSDGNAVPLISGRPLGFVDGKEPFYIGTPLSRRNFEVSFNFVKNDPYARLKALLPRFEHPTYPLFVKRVHVVPPPEPETVVEKPTRRDGEKMIIPRPPIGKDEAKAYERKDGRMRINCWRTPNIVPLGIDPLKPRRNPRLGSISAAGAGEVVYSSPPGSGDMVVVLYHGGGLFTRYWGLRELRLPRNGRLNAGQTIGHVHLAPARQTTPVHWQPLLGGVGGPGEVKPQAILDLSSRLCDSK